MMNDKMDWNKKIEDALSSAPSFELDEKFNQLVFRKIDRLEAKSRRNEWFVYSALIGFFGMVSIIIVILFMENITNDQIQTGVSWLFMIGGLLVAFQIIENKYIKHRDLT